MIDLSAVKTLYNSMMDSLVSSTGLAVPCNVVHEDPKGSGCPNCYINPVTGRSSSRFEHTIVEPIIGKDRVADDMYIVYMDENSTFYSSGSQNTQQSGLDFFRAAYPSSLVFILDVAREPLQIVYPSGFLDDDKVFSARVDAGVYITRDSGVASGATDSYQVMQNIIASGVSSTVSGLFNNATSATIARDNSDSMVPSDVAATYSGLLTSLANTGVVVNNTTIFEHEEMLCPFTVGCVEKTSVVSAFLNYCDTYATGTISANYCSGVPVTNVESSREVSGEFVWFPEGHICPVCNGAGFFPTTTIQARNIVVVFDNKKFINFGNVNVQQGDMQTITPISMYTDLTTADYITVDTSVTPYAQNKFTRVSEPQPVGLGSNRYIFTNWERSS